MPCELLILGEAAGRQEEMWGICPICQRGGSMDDSPSCPNCRAPLVHTPTPFTGPSGYMLFKELADMGLSRSRARVDNVVPLRPPVNDLSRLSELGLSLADFEQRLADMLREVRPRVVLAVGATALQALTGLGEINSRRGSPLRLRSELRPLLPDAWVIPCIHPAAIMRMRGGESSYAGGADDDDATAQSKGGMTYSVGRITLRKDVGRALDFLRNASLAPLRRQLRVRPSLDEALAYIASCYDAGMVAFDTERRLDQVCCISLARSATDAMSIPLWDGWVPAWPLEQELVLLRALQDFMKSDVPKVGQNVCYDMRELRKHGIAVDSVLLDTAALHRVLWPELPRTLQFMASVLTLEPFWKHERKDAGGTGSDAPSDEEKLWTYNARDSAVTHEVATRLLVQLDKAGLTYQFWPGDLRCPE